MGEDEELDFVCWVLLVSSCGCPQPYQLSAHIGENDPPRHCPMTTRPVLAMEPDLAEFGSLIQCSIFLSPRDSGARHKFGLTRDKRIQPNPALTQNKIEKIQYACLESKTVIFALPAVCVFLTKNNNSRRTKSSSQMSPSWRMKKGKKRFRDSMLQEQGPSSIVPERRKMWDNVLQIPNVFLNVSKGPGSSERGFGEELSGQESG